MAFNPDNSHLWRNGCEGCCDQIAPAPPALRPHNPQKCCLKCRNFALAEKAANAVDDSKYRQHFQSLYGPQTTEVVNCRDPSDLKGILLVSQDLKVKVPDGRPHPFIEAIANEIVQGLTTKTDKAYALFYWLAHNICFDMSQYDRNIGAPKYADDVLRDKTGVCKNFVSLFAEMWSTLTPRDNTFNPIIGVGRRNRLIEPPAGQVNLSWDALTEKERNQTDQHAWNCLLLDDSFSSAFPKLMDVTYAATQKITADGYKVTKPYNSKWFTKNNFSDFFVDHFPTDSITKVLSQNNIHSGIANAPSTYSDWWHLEDLPQEAEGLHIVDMEKVKPNTLELKILSEKDETPIEFSVQLSCAHWQLPENQVFALCIMGDTQWAQEWWIPLDRNDAVGQPTVWSKTFKEKKLFYRMRSAYLFLIRLVKDANDWKRYRDPGDDRGIPWIIRWKVTLTGTKQTKSSKPKSGGLPTLQTTIQTTTQKTPEMNPSPSITPASATQLKSLPWDPGYKIPKKNASQTPNTSTTLSNANQTPQTQAGSNLSKPPAQTTSSQASTIYKRTSMESVQQPAPDAKKRNVSPAPNNPPTLVSTPQPPPSNAVQPPPTVTPPQPNVTQNPGGVGQSQNKPKQDPTLF